MLRRITALFNHITNLPPIFSTAEKPDLQPQVVEQPPKPRSTFDENRPKASAQNRPPPSDWEAPAPVISVPSPPNKSEIKGKKPERKVPDESETEDEADDEGDDDGPPQKKLPETEKQDDAVMASPSPSPVPSSSLSKAKAKSRVVASRSPSPQHSDPEPPQPKPPSSSAAKKPRLADPSSDDDSDAAPKPAQTAGARRGARQPVKRGGKRF
ncbi:hypothetical protein EST38_g4812 [Candolleomyces aberdarensis]|uniref:Uncharacterized protein n=1 Tax=Candolleomyces aberdarensis TaxID=2316362 RepID=A0A4Q2DPG1_9AGAR|nr:hypothetical protein EST38_g4812 [Candolleomyces aberdarensis]